MKNKFLIAIALVCLLSQNANANSLADIWNSITNYAKSIFGSKPPDNSDNSFGTRTNNAGPANNTDNDSLGNNPNSNENVHGLVEKVEQSNCPQIGDLREVTRCEEFSQFKETVDLCNNQASRSSGGSVSSGGNVGTGN